MTDTNSPIAIKAMLGQKVRKAKMPRRIGFGFGSLVNPREAKSIVKSSGPTPKANPATPTQNTAASRNRIG